MYLLNISFYSSIFYFNKGPVIGKLLEMSNTDIQNVDLSDFKAIAPLCLPVIELLAATVDVSPDELLKEFNIDGSNIGGLELKLGDMSKKIQLIMTQDNTYETNIAEEAGKLPEQFKSRMLSCGGYLLLVARVFYKRLIQEYPDKFTEFTEKIKHNGKNPDLLRCLGVNTERTTLYLEEDGRQLGLLVI